MRAHTTNTHTLYTAVLVLVLVFVVVAELHFPFVFHPSTSNDQYVAARYHHVAYRTMSD